MSNTGAFNRSSGLADAIAIKKSKRYSDDRPQVKKKIVGSFGIVDNGFVNKLHWVVGDRKDRRHGVVSQPGHLGAYQNSLLEEMFRKW